MLSLYQQYLEEGDAFKPRYFDILSAGGSDAPARILDRAGVDIRSAEFWQGGFDVLRSSLERLEALDIVAKTAGNKTIEKAIYDVRSGIAEGRTMADPLAESNVFPPMVCQMISVGESTGALDAMLEKIADFYDEEVDQAVENLTSLIEPFMLVFLGVTIGGLVVAMYLPIFKMAGAIG